MSIFTPFINVWSWFQRNFVDHIKSTAVVAVTITEAVKAILNNPIAGFLESTADVVTHSQLPSDIAIAINGIIPKVLAVELGVEGLPQDATPAQVLTFEQSILGAFNVTSNNSKLYTELAAQIYGEIQTTVNTTPGNFADWVNAVEGSWNDYQADLNGQSAASIDPAQPSALSGVGADVPPQQ